jgi:hypothetical protein
MKGKGIMTLAKALTGKSHYVRRKTWLNIMLSNCNGIIYIHTGVNDPLGRLWHPTVMDIAATDWVEVNR